MSSRPWHKRYHSDALTGYAGLTLEQRGAYTTILDSLYDSDGAVGLPDIDRRIAGILDVSARRWRIIRDDLIRLGKIEIVDGLITNSRYLRELERQRRISEKRAKAGKAGGKAKAENSQGNLDLQSANAAKNSETALANASALPETCQTGEKHPSEPQNYLENSSKTQHFEQFSTHFQTETDCERDTKPAENSRSPVANAKQIPSYTRANPETRDQSLYKKPSTTTESLALSDDDDFPLLDDKPTSPEPLDLIGKVEKLGRISGLNLTVPAKLVQATDQLKQWLGEGIGFEETIVPAIETRTRENPTEPIFSLKYFDAVVRKAHAVASVGGRPHRAPPPPKPKAPIGLDDDADQRCERFRARLAYAVGPDRYAARYAPGHVAVTISDERFLTVTFRSSAEEATSRMDEQAMTDAAQRLGLSFRSRVK